MVEPLTLDFEELRKRWMGLYLNLMMIKSRSPTIDGFLKAYKDKFAETNEYMMKFFDAMQEAY